MYHTANDIIHSMRKNIPHWLQDVDTGYLTKVELEDKVSSLQDEFNFYKAFYDSVSSFSCAKQLLHTVIGGYFLCLLCAFLSFIIAFI